MKTAKVIMRSVAEKIKTVDSLSLNKFNKRIFCLFVKALNTLRVVNKCLSREKERGTDMAKIP